MSHSFSQKFGTNSTETLISTFHPTLSPFDVKAISLLEPEYGPGSIEYEIAVNFLKSTTDTPISRPMNTADRTLTSIKRPTLPKEYYLTTEETTWRDSTNLHNEKYNSSEESLDKTNSLHSLIPFGALLFLFGFLLMPCWWIGAILPRGPRTKVQQRWCSYNRLMSIFSVIVLIIGVGTLIWYFK
ncbi:hypothetical protein K7432_006821 [Basidiobolus ranarum]|uniref:Uncharacterized protein n=1 Tax=Basidiobolus ranarum TaxID=34480 RepID=A0ABR2W129_9FUNG